MDQFDNNQIIQVCIAVKDIGKTARNYAELFGVEMPQIKLVPPEEEAHTKYRGNPCKSRAKMCSFNMGAISLELMQPDGQPSIWKEALDTKGEGVCYLGLFVQDSAETIEFLQGKGIPLVHRGDTATGNYNCVDSTEQLGVRLNVKQKY